MSFIYRAGAVAFGGRMTRPHREAPPAQASVTLPPVGGYASAAVQDFRYCHEGEELVAFHSASSLVVGGEGLFDGKRVFATQATVTIEGLRILKTLVTADRMVGRLVSRFPEEAGQVELPMLPECSSIWNLRIDGQPLDPQPNPLLLQHAHSVRSAIDRLSGLHVRPPSRDAAAKNPKAPTCCSIFDEGSLQTTREALKQYAPKDRGVDFELGSGWEIRIPNFGRIYLGEYLVFEDRRVLNMMRLEMGSPRAGFMTLGSVEGNGSPN